MSPPPPPPGSAAAPPLSEVGALRALVNAVKNRIVSGLILALPIALTFWILFWLYATVKQVVLDPTIFAVRYLILGEEAAGAENLRNSWVLYNVVSPAIATVIVLAFLYFLGWFVRSRTHRAIDWLLLHLPVVTTIYKALSNVFESVGAQLQGGGNKFQRVVLVEFPHPGCRALAFVTNTLREASTDSTILCVCVLTGVMPPSGFTLYVPSDKVIDIDWSMNQSLQSILSGGITSPSSIHYFQGVTPPPTGPIVDPSGHPILSERG